jgi:hypothetical protein
MAAVGSQPFSLFPRSVPTIATPNPHNRAPSLHSVKPLSHVLSTEEPLPSPQPWVQKPSGLSHYVRQETPSPDDIGMAVTTMSPVDGSTPSPVVTHAPAQFTTPPPPPRAASSPSPQQASLRSGSATLVQDASGKTDPSPIVPIRSMFPTYNPSLPLQQQNYYPQRPFPVRQSSMTRSIASRSDYRDSVVTPIDRAVGPLTAPASVLNFPVDIMSINEPQFSSHRELEKLWEASHGCEPSRDIKTYALEMAR